MLSSDSVPAPTSELFGNLEMSFRTKSPPRQEVLGRPWQRKPVKRVTLSNPVGSAPTATVATRRTDPRSCGWFVLLVQFGRRADFGFMGLQFTQVWKSLTWKQISHFPFRFYDHDDDSERCNWVDSDLGSTLRCRYERRTSATRLTLRRGRRSYYLRLGN